MAWICQPCRWDDHDSCQGEVKVCFCPVCWADEDAPGLEPPQLCKTCGCSPPDSENNDHGDSRNITHRDLVGATKTKDATAKTVSGIIRTMARTHRRNRK